MPCEARHRLGDVGKASVSPRRLCCLSRQQESNSAAPLRLATKKAPTPKPMPGLSCAIETACLAKRQAWWLDDIHLNQKYPVLRRVVRPQGLCSRILFLCVREATSCILRLAQTAPAAWRYSPRSVALVSIAGGASGVCKGLPEMVPATGSNYRSRDYRRVCYPNGNTPRKWGIGSPEGCD